MVYLLTCPIKITHMWAKYTIPNSHGSWKGMCFQDGNRMVDILGKDVELEILKLPREEQILGKSIADPIESSQTLVFGDVAARKIAISVKVTQIFGQL